MNKINWNKTVIRLLTVKPTAHSSSERTWGNGENILLLVEIDENQKFLGEHLQESQISVWYEPLSPSGQATRERHQFDAHYQRSFDGTRSAVCISGKLHASSVFLDPAQLRGRRIGTYLMNEIVKWAKQWPDADVRKINLNSNQAGTSHVFNTERRNHFYERFGIEFDYSDPSTKESGVSKAMKASQLKEVNSWKENIEEASFSDYLNNLHAAAANVSRERNVAVDNLAYCERHIEKMKAAKSKRSLKTIWLTSAIWVAVGLFLWSKGIVHS